MSAERADLVVVGGGPAGMMAAIAAAEQGADVVLVDNRNRLGGNYYKEALLAAAGTSSPAGYEGPAELEQMQASLVTHGVRQLDRTAVWGVFHCDGPTFREGGREGDDRFRLQLAGPHTTSALEARALVLAPGVYDRSIPFPDWTLPGILSPGGAQLLLENQGVLPGKRILVAGTGPLLLVVAAALADAGAEVVGLLETSAPLDGWQQGPLAVWGQGARLREAWGYLRVLRRHRVPLHFRHALFRALGEGEVEAAVFGRVNALGHPIPGTERQVAVDTICFGYGFFPNISLTLHLGCEHVFDPDLRAHVPLHSQAMETTTPGVFVAGDVTGVGGKDLARLQGRVAGLGAAERLGLLSSAALVAGLKALRPRIRSELRFREALWRRFRLRPGLLELIDDGTIICRCEAVNQGAIRTAIEDGFRDLSGIKRQTRSGMGLCQGRYCAAVVSEILARQTGTDVGGYVPLKVRPPLTPIRASELVGPGVSG